MTPLSKLIAQGIYVFDFLTASFLTEYSWVAANDINTTPIHIDGLAINCESLHTWYFNLRTLWDPCVTSYFYGTLYNSFIPEL